MFLFFHWFPRLGGSRFVAKKARRLVDGRRTLPYSATTTILGSALGCQVSRLCAETTPSFNDMRDSTDPAIKKQQMTGHALKISAFSPKNAHAMSLVKLFQTVYKRGVHCRNLPILDI